MMSGDESVENYDNRKNLERWKSSRKKVDWESEEDRINYLLELHYLIDTWQDVFPNLLDIFRPEEIDWLLIESVKFGYKNFIFNLVDFVIRTGYKDEPKVNSDGKPLVRRTTAVHHAARMHPLSKRLVIGVLFKIYDRFDVNYTDESGLTHFHAACMIDVSEMVKKFLDLGQDPNCLVEETGDSPLHLALSYNYDIEVVELLLRAGANPNPVNKLGLTPLQTICMIDECNDELAVSFIETIDEIQPKMQIDVRHKDNDCLLIHALYNNNKKVAESLLRRGADPNFANSAGMTPLHAICMRRYHDDELAESFFKINDELNQLVKVDEKDVEGLTPLEWAVANMLPRVIDVLLDRGADIFSFAFPTNNFGHLLVMQSNDFFLNFQLRLATRALAVVERLEEKGYEMKRCDVLTIMTFFAEHGLFEKSADLKRILNEDEKYAKIAKEIKIREDNPSLSLYDMMRSQPDESVKLFTRSDYVELVRSKKLGKLPQMWHDKACAENLCERLSRRFFRRWVLDSFLELTRYQLPILCCEVIIEKLMNKDLWHICLATGTEDLSSIF